MASNYTLINENGIGKDVEGCICGLIKGINLTCVCGKTQKTFTRMAAPRATIWTHAPPPPPANKNYGR
jgi:hypothetical protein